MGIWINDFVEEKYNAFIIGASLEEKFFCLQYSFKGKKILWLTKQAVTGIIINSFNTLPLYCDRANENKQMSQKSLLMWALFCKQESTLKVFYILVFMRVY